MTGRSPAEGVKRLDTAIKVNGEAIYGMEGQAARNSERRDQGLPSVRGQAQELRCLQGGVDAQREEGGHGRGQRRRGHRRHLVERQDRARSAADRVGRRPERHDFQRHHCRRAQAGPRCRPGHCRQPERRHQRTALAGAAKKVEAVYAYPYQHHVTLEPMNSTVLYTPERCEAWASVQDGEQALAATAEAAGIPVTKCEFYKTFLGGGFGRRSTSLDYLRQAVLVAKEMPGTPVKLLWSRRRGHDPRLVSSHHPMQDDRRVRRQEEPHRAANPHFRPVDPRDGGAGPDAERHGSRDLRRLLQGRTRRGIRLRGPNTPDRSRHAQSARAAGILGGREHQPQRHLYRESFMDELAKEDGRRSASSSAAS